MGLPITPVARCHDFMGGHSSRPLPRMIQAEGSIAAEWTTVQRFDAGLGVSFARCSAQEV